MAAIRIDDTDKKTATRGTVKPKVDGHYEFVLSEAPDREWLEFFKCKIPGLTIKIENNRIIVDGPAPVEATPTYEAVQKCIDAANKAVAELQERREKLKKELNRLFPPKKARPSSPRARAKR